MSQAPAKKSDLPTRIASAIVMLAVAAAAFWIGGAVLAAFIWLVALVGFAECVLLVSKATDRRVWRAIGIVAAATYFGLASWNLASIDNAKLIALIGAVICVDVFAYFFGRTFGGPKIAPRISPSKTWSGLAGGIVGASLFFVLFAMHLYSVAFSEPLFSLGAFWQDAPHVIPLAFLVGGVTAVLAQAGDFFESWLKRRAGVKDSSNLIPGHGGVFDRVDGLLAVAFVDGVISIASSGYRF